MKLFSLNKTGLIKNLIIIYSRYLLGGALVFASLIKIKGLRFTSTSGIDYPIDTAWHFFETLFYSGIYWKFIGASQLLAGFLLMTQKYSRLGAICSLPIVLNIFVITMSYDFGLTPIITALMLISNISLIIWDWDSLKILINKKPRLIQFNGFQSSRIWFYTGLILFLFTFSYRLFYNKYNIFLWLGGCMFIGVVGLVIGLKKGKA